MPSYFIMFAVVFRFYCQMFNDWLLSTKTNTNSINTTTTKSFVKQYASIVSCRARLKYTAYSCIRSMNFELNSNFVLLITSLIFSSDASMNSPSFLTRHFKHSFDDLDLIRFTHCFVRLEFQTELFVLLFFFLSSCAIFFFFVCVHFTDMARNRILKMIVHLLLIFSFFTYTF